FDDCFKTQAQKKGFRHYLGGLLGESERKNLTQMADNAVGVIYNRLHHFLTTAPWQASDINERRLKVMNQCRQTQIKAGFDLILDDSGHRKSGNFTEGVGRQYLGEIGKVDQGIVVVTTHLYDGKKSLPLDIEIYQHASFLEGGKDNPNFKKKPEIGLDLINRSLTRGYRPGLILMDAGYGNNKSFLKELESKKLKYLAAVAKNRKVMRYLGSEREEKRLDEWAKTLSFLEFEEVALRLNKPKTIWVAIFEGQIVGLEGQRSFAIAMNAKTFEEATEIDYFITNVDPATVTAEWIVTSYAKRNWIEVFYREVKGWLGLRDYQVRGKRSLMRHFILVFCAYTFILWHQLTGGLRRRWANQSLNTFKEALEAFRTAIAYRFVAWLRENQDVFAAYKAGLGLIWA
ncbi:MAG: IS701 family transposase, partial [Halothece sp.]